MKALSLPGGENLFFFASGFPENLFKWFYHMVF